MIEIATENGYPCVKITISASELSYCKTKKDVENLINIFINQAKKALMDESNKVCEHISKEN